MNTPSPQSSKPTTEPGDAPMMHTRYSKILQWFFGRLFDGIDYPQQSADEINALAKDGIVVYVARAPSAWLYLYLNHALRKLGLPLAQYVAGFSFVLWQPVSKLWRWWLKRSDPPNGPWRASYQSSSPGAEEARYADAVLRGQTSFLMLQPRSGLKMRRKGGPNNFVRALVAVQRVIDKPIYIIPHVLTDRAFSGSTGKLAKRIFGGRRQPGSLREMAIRVSTLKTATIRTGTVVNLQEFLEGQQEVEDLKLARKLSHELSKRLSKEERVIAGPEIPDHETMARHVLREPFLRDVIRDEAKRLGRTESAIEKKAGSYVKEIAARYNVNMLRFLEGMISILFNRIYDGVYFDSEGYAKLTEAARKGPLIFCPCHRSHVDYLALSHTLWRNGMMPPHIAAGINLSFFPMGLIFRGCGAFFLRRSFRDNALYGAVFKAYMYEVLHTGISIEFFLEGTRTRTGKLLMPRYGLLNMVVDAWRRGAQGDLQFIPVSIDYEKIIEAGSYARELRGGEKKKEDMGALLRTTGVLRSRYGRLHLQFGEPLSMREFAEKSHLAQSPDETHDDSWRQGVQRLGFDILHRISKACTVTPTTIAATVLLNHHGRGISQSSLTEQSQWMLEFLDEEAARFSSPLQHQATREAAVLEAVEKLVDDGTVSVERPGRGDAEPIYYVSEDHRVELDFPKNQSINHFAPSALIARCLLKEDKEQSAYEDIKAGADLLSSVFKREFVFRVDVNFDVAFDECLATLAARGYLDVTEDNTIVMRNKEKLELLSGFLDSFVEAYWATLGAVTELRRFPLWEKELTNRALEQTRRAFLEGKLKRPEAANKTLIGSALNWLQDKKVIVIHGGDKKRTIALSEDYAGPELDALQETLSRFL